jgi:putative ATP-binding cassette transporter
MSEPTADRKIRTPPGTFLRRIARLAGPYWNCGRKWQVRGMSLLLLLLTVGQVGISVWGNYWNKALFNALEARSVRGVVIQVGVFALILAASIGVTAAHLIVKRWLQLDWRAWVTQRLVGTWMDEGRHYRLLFIPGEHDNPDGRIAEDIRIATESAVALAHTLVYSALSLGLFIDILWTVSGTLTVPGTSIEVPGYLVPLAFLYAGVGSALGFSLGRPLTRATNAMQTAEASFRFGLARAREHSEAIALMHGEPMERAGAATRFAQVLRNWDRQSLAYLGIVAFTTGYGGLLPVFPILVAAPQYIMGAMSLGLLMQAAQAFQTVTAALSWPVDNVGELANCRASAERALTLHEGMRRLDAQARAPNRHHIAVVPAGGPRLVIEELCIAEPSGRILLEHFSTNIRRGERVLVAGDPAVTNSFFKVLGGLWPWGRGRVRLPDGGDMLFMPQRPFLPEGTLREVLCYPRRPDGFPDRAVRHALECAGIGWLGPRLDKQESWEQALPLRAQQRLGFARALLQRPAWIVMEEATDAFDPKGERLILEMLRHELPDTALLTISFHPGLEQLHDRKIVLNRVTETKNLT